MFAGNQAAWLAFLWGFSLKGTVILCAVYVAAVALRKSSAATRHLVWTAAFAALLVLPILSVSLPSLRIPGASVVLPEASNLVFRTTVTEKSAVGSAAPSAPIATRDSQRGNRRGSGAPWWLILAWPAGSLIMLGQMIVAYWGMARKRAAARALPFAQEPVGLPSGVRVLEGATGSMPAAFGILRPVVFMPADAAGWSEERRRLVLQHELAHVERADPAAHLMARCSLSLLWWHPLAWAAWREFLKERERAADDMVLGAGARASDYASLLLDVARSMQPQSAAGCAAVCMARRSELEGRLVAILDSHASRGATRRGSALVAAAAAVVLCAPIAAVRAQAPQTGGRPEIEATIRAAYAQKNSALVDDAAVRLIQAEDYDSADALLRAGLEIRASASGEQSAEYAVGLVKLGELAEKRNKPVDATAFYTKAVALGDRPEVVPALIYLGIHSRSALQLFTGSDYLQRAVALAATPQESGRALTWLALNESYDPALESQAENHFQAAISALDPASTEESTALNLFARFLEQHDRADEASQLRARASSIIQSLVSSAQGSGPASAAGVFRVGNDVSRPQLVTKVEPQYTEEARAAKYQGTVVLSVVIGADGIARHAKVMKGLGLGLDQKAVEAVGQWVFAPGVKDGLPVAVQATIEVNFRLF